MCFFLVLISLIFLACPAQAVEDAVASRRLLPRDFAEQLRIDEYTQQTQTTITEYRPVALDKIPVPSSGGNLTGKRVVSRAIIRGKIIMYNVGFLRLRNSWIARSPCPERARRPQHQLPHSRRETIIIQTWRKSRSHTHARVYNIYVWWYVYMRVCI